jgi:AAA domain/DnaB-like helicase N terminal domain
VDEYQPTLDNPATPPFSLEAEIGLIGAALLDPGIPRAVTVTAADFYKPAHETMWAAITTLNGVNDRPLALLELLQRQGDLNRVGGGPYIHTCISHAIPSAATQYADIITRNARLRRAQQATSRAHQRLAQADPDDYTGILFEAMSDLEDVANEATTRLETTTWEPLPLDDVLAGRELDQAPTLMPRTDGHCLIYSGAVHALSGEPGSGKTWIALHAAKHELDQGNRVIVIDFEDRASRVIGRLLGIGAKPDHIRKQFSYIRPHRPLDDIAKAHLTQAITGHTLVILDGVTEAMSLHGLDLSSNPDVATFYTLLPRWIADHGPAVILIDHVVKDTDKQGRWAIGGQHKLAGLDGVAYLVKTIDPFGRGKKGTARIIIAKDRAGFVEEYALGRTAAEFHLDARTPDILHAALDAPSAMPTADDGHLRPTTLMGRVATFLTLHPGASRTAIEEGVHGKGHYVRQALDCLIQEGYVEVEDGPRRAKFHRLVQLFNTEDEDPQ